MKKFYLRFRILLITFTVGLASVFMMNGSLQTSDEIFVNLPQIESDSPIVVYPEYERFMRHVGGSGGITKCNRRELSEEEMKKIDRMTK